MFLDCGVLRNIFLLIGDTIIMIVNYHRDRLELARTALFAVCSASSVASICGPWAWQRPAGADHCYLKCQLHQTLGAVRSVFIIAMDVDVFNASRRANETI